MNMHTENLGIERNCIAGTPTYDKPTAGGAFFIDQ